MSGEHDLDPARRSADGLRGAGDARLAHRAIALGVVLRLVYGLILHPPLDYVTSDMAGYVQRAERLAGGGRIPRIDLFMPVGTQLLISLPMRLAGTGRAGLWAASLLWCALSCAFPWFAWRWASGILSPRAAAITAAGCALSPLAIIYGGYFSSELPAMVLLPAVLWLIHRGGTRPHRAAVSAAAAGATAVVLLVVRQQFALNLAVAGWSLVVAAGWRNARRMLVPAVAGGVATLAIVIVLGAPPWRVVGGAGTVGGENGGVNFFYGRCDARIVTTADLFFENPVRAQRETGHDIGLETRHGADQGYFYRQGFSCLGRDPVRGVVLGLRSVADMTATSIPFPPWTEGGIVLVVAELANVIFCIVGVGLVAAAVKARRDAVPKTLLVHLACGFVVAIAFIGEPRYRLPYDLFVWALLGWWISRRDGPATVSARSRVGEAEGPLQ